MNGMFRRATLFNQDLTSWHERVNEIVGYPDTRDAEGVDIFHESGMQLINYPRFGIEERLRMGNENRANFDNLSMLASMEVRRDPTVENENRAQALRTMREIFQAAEYGDPQALYKFGGKKKRKSLKKKRKSKRRKSMKKKQRKTKRKGRR